MSDQTSQNSVNRSEELRPSTEERVENSTSENDQAPNLTAPAETPTNITVIVDNETLPVFTTTEVTSPGGITVPDGRLPQARRERTHGRGCGRFAMPNQWKDLKSQHGQWTCFLCCHVRTGTIAIGVWHLTMHLLALAVIAIAIIRPDILIQVDKDTFEGEELQVTQDEDGQDVQAVNCSEMPCLLAAQDDERLGNTVLDYPLSFGNILSTHRLNAEDVNIALFITLCTFLVTLLLIFGAVEKQPSHLMPFFFLQVFDFCITCMTMFGYLSYLTNIRQLISETSIFPFRQLQRQLLMMSGRCLTFFVVFVFVATFMVKVYCINIVWRCYKYLMHRAEGASWPLRSRLGHTLPVDQESQTLVFGQELPDYDTAITDPQFRKKNSRLFPEPPPSYDMAMAAYFSQQQILSQARANTGATSNTPSFQGPSSSPQTTGEGQTERTIVSNNN